MLIDGLQKAPLRTSGRSLPPSHALHIIAQIKFLPPLSGPNPVSCLSECGFSPKIAAAENAFSSLHHFFISRSILNQFSCLGRSKASNGLKVLPIAGLGPDGKCHRLSAFNSTILKSNQISQHNFYAALRPAVPFFLRSAHLFFIMSDNRFLPSAVRC